MTNNTNTVTDWETPLEDATSRITTLERVVARREREIYNSDAARPHYDAFHGVTPLCASQRDPRWIAAKERLDAELDALTEADPLIMKCNERIASIRAFCDVYVASLEIFCAFIRAEKSAKRHNAYMRRKAVKAAKAAAQQ